MKMRHRLKRHSLKFVSVLLSVFLWTYVLNSEKVRFEKTVSLDYILPDDMMFATRPLHEVTFLVEGPRAFVRTVADHEDRLVIDLNRANKRRSLNFSIDINPAQLNLPFGMIAERVLPRRIPISLEKKVSRIVPLKIRFAGQLPKELSLLNPQLDPPEVEVSGPRSLIANLKELSLRPVDLEHLSGRDEVPVEVQLPDERLSLATGLAVRLTYQLKATTSNFELKQLPIKFISSNRIITASSNTADVKLLLSDKIKNRLNVSPSVQILAEIPLSAKGRLSVPLKVVLPPNVHLLQVRPNSIIVNVE